MECGRCHRPTDTSRYRYCPACREQIRARKAARAAAGRCVECGKPSEPTRRRCAQCLERSRASSAAYERLHPGARASEKARHGVMRNWVIKCKAVYVLGGHCVDCSEEDVRVLEFDHVNGDGWLERKAGQSMTGNNRYRWILKHPEEAAQRFQVLCANCHTRKSLRDLRGGSTTNASRASALPALDSPLTN